MQIPRTLRIKLGRRYFVAAIAVAIAATATFSNMGFQIYHVFAAGGGVTSATGVSTLGLPYKRKPGINSASDLMNDVGKSNVVYVARYLRASNALQVYTGRKGSAVDFPLVAGEGYLVRVSTSAKYFIDGSHDGTLSIPLLAADGGVNSLTGDNLFVPPYNATASNAKQLLDDIGFASVSSVSRYLSASDSLQVYTGRKNGGLAFPLTPGEAYYVKMNSTVNYVPSHY